MQQATCQHPGLAERPPSALLLCILHLHDHSVAPSCFAIANSPALLTVMGDLLSSPHTVWIQVGSKEASGVWALQPKDRAYALFRVILAWRMPMGRIRSDQLEPTPSDRDPSPPTTAALPVVPYSTPQQALPLPFALQGWPWDDME